MKKIKNPTACIIIIGNEILSGRTLDTNKNFMCKELTLKGIDVIEARIIKDDIKKIITVINEVRKKYDYIFTDKSLDNFFYIDLIKEIFPKAKVVNCKRNALSCIMSILKNNLTGLGWSHNLEHIFKYIDIYYEL